MLAMLCLLGTYSNVYLTFSRIFIVCLGALQDLDFHIEYRRHLSEGKAAVDRGCVVLTFYPGI